MSTVIPYWKQSEKNETKRKHIPTKGELERWLTIQEIARAERELFKDKFNRGSGHNIRGVESDLYNSEMD